MIHNLLILKVDWYVSIFVAPGIEFNPNIANKL